MLIAIIVILSILLIASNYLWAARANKLYSQKQVYEEKIKEIQDKVNSLYEKTDYKVKIVPQFTNYDVVPLTISIEVPKDLTGEFAIQFLESSLINEISKIVPNYCKLDCMVEDYKRFATIYTYKLLICEPKN